MASMATATVITRIAQERIMSTDARADGHCENREEPRGAHALSPANSRASTSALVAMETSPAVLCRTAKLGSEECRLPNRVERKVKCFPHQIHNRDAREINAERPQRHDNLVYRRVCLRRSEFPTTLTDESAIAAAAMMGDSRSPKKGYSKPAATGTPRAL